MRIAILGTGNVGRVLGRRWAQAGHSIIFGSRDPDSERVRGLAKGIGGPIRTADWQSAAEAAELVVLAVPWSVVPQLMATCGPALHGKTLVDCINPLLPDLSGLELGHITSAAEQIASWVPQARVVKAFNTVSAATMANPSYGDRRATLFLCGDDQPAKDQVRALASDLGFAPIDAGPLSMARCLEPLAMLYIHLAIHRGLGSQCAFELMRR